MTSPPPTGSISTTAALDSSVPLLFTACSYGRPRQVTSSGHPVAAKLSRARTAMPRDGGQFVQSVEDRQQLAVVQQPAHRRPVGGGEIVLPDAARGEVRHCPSTISCRYGNSRNAVTMPRASPSSGSDSQCAPEVSPSTTSRPAATGRPVDDHMTRSGIGWLIPYCTTRYLYRVPTARVSSSTRSAAPVRARRISILATMASSRIVTPHTSIGQPAHATWTVLVARLPTSAKATENSTARVPAARARAARSSTGPHRFPALRCAES
ncbi:hypothetical protein [Nonomuraea sp. 10N515B]|uniref:hypothetical protein n=1 Tax=Nonomuraea sp. 10N515B TaxID=3457422 RepID=UPI003FCE5757